MAPKRRIDDAGEKIAGARKDWRLAPMTAVDLTGMTDEEIVLEVKKDNVWPKPDYEKLVADGMPVEVAAHVKIIRDRMAQEPKARRSIEPAVLRRAFVEMTTLVREHLEACRSVDDVRSAYSAIQEAVGGTFKATNDTWTGYMSVFKGRSCPFYVDYGDATKVAKMIREGFPGKTIEWKKGVSVYPRPDGTFLLTRNNIILQRDLPSEEAAWEWARANYVKPTKAPRGDSKVEPKRPHLDSVERSGLEFSLEGRDISPEDFIETFGFRGVQFGNWLPDDERQRVLNMGYEAMMDLASVLGWEPKAMSLGGTLSVAFGARGNGGKAAAHYEPGQRIVNMTRLSGAGTLAHEFGHALDHWCGTGTEAIIHGVPSGSGWYDQMSQARRTEVLAHRGAEVASNWEGLMTAMCASPLSREAKMELCETRKNNILESIGRNRDNMERERAKEPARQNKNYLKKAAKWEAERQTVISKIDAEIDRLRHSNEDVVGATSSDFLNQANALCRSTDYWKRPTELFARAFEAYVHDAIAEGGGVSQYLVNGVEEDTFADEMYRGNPYPTGEERKRINEAMSTLTRSLTAEVENALDTGKSLAM